MNLLPKPKSLKINEGFLKTKTVCIKTPCSDDRINKALSFLKQDSNGAELVISYNSGEGEGYTLDIYENRIVISGEGERGVFYGAQTLKQIFENENIPCLHIEDAPDMPYRGFYHDVTRGKVPTVKTLKRLIDILASYKMNSFQIYVEHTFPFKEFGADIEKFGYLTPEEIKELDDYCYDNFIEFIPSIATFGHLYELLQRKEYKELQSAENYTAEKIFWAERMKHHTIDPENEKSIEVIKSMIDQYMPLFRSDKFNICCDETFDLKCGKHKDKDTGKLYVGFVKKIIEYVTSKGKKVMMWGDIVLEYPEKLNELPPDVTFLNWDYIPEVNEENVITFKNAGVRQIVCPGVWTFEGIRRMVTRCGVNICRLLDLGYKHSACGMLNTNWGNYGHPYGIELSEYGLVLSAAKSWNIATAADEEFENSINALQFKNENTVKYLRMVESAYTEINVWNTLALCYSDILFGSKQELPKIEEIKYALDVCRKITDELENQVWEKDNYRREIILGAECTIVASEIFLKLCGSPREDATDIKEWLKKYRENWLASNKESELCEIEKMFNCLNDI